MSFGRWSSITLALVITLATISLAPRIEVNPSSSKTAATAGVFIGSLFTDALRTPSAQAQVAQN